MLTGTVFYYDATGRRTNDMDHDVSADYAVSVSKKWHWQIVEWSCTNGDRRDVRYYRDGKLLSDAEVTSALGPAARNG